MGTTTSLNQQRYGCGLCQKKFDYKKAMSILKSSVNQYQSDLQKNINQFQEKDQKVVRQNLNQVKQQAFNYLKNDEEIQAKKILTDFFRKQKQPKLITRQIDFLENKQKKLNDLQKQISISVKPYGAKQKRNQIMKFDQELKKIQQMQFNANQDQKSGDSGDIQAYIDRIMDQLKSKIPPPPPIIQSVVSEKKPASVLKQEPVKQHQQHSGEQNREKFLKKLWKYKLADGERFRQITSDQVSFFKNNFGICLTENRSSFSRRNQDKGSERKVYYGGQEDRQSDFYDGEDIPSIGQISHPSMAKIDGRARGYYLNCNGFQIFDMQEFIKSDWVMVEVLDLQQCGISSHWWKMLAKGQRKSLPNLKVLYLGLNQIMQVNYEEMQMLSGVQYLSFGWWNQSNQLTDQSKKVISQFQQNHPNIKIQFPQT